MNARALFGLSVLMGACSERADDASRLPDRFSGRDGKVEASADIKAGKPAKLYLHVSRGVVVGYRTPGVSNCSFSDSHSLAFPALPELDFQEGVPPSARYDSESASSAYRFAVAYNRETFRKPQLEVRAACPDAQLEQLPDQPT